MYNQIERELKCLLTKEQYKSMINSYDFHINIHQTNTYYDTKDNYMKSIKGAIRIRTIEDTYIFTLKIRTDDITLIELEKEIKDNSIQTAFADEEIKGWLQKYSIPMDVEKIISFSTNRKMILLENAELCLDHTTFGNHSDYEIEYEYTKDHDGISEFNKILVPFGLEYKKNCPSKLARALNFMG